MLTNTKEQTVKLLEVIVGLKLGHDVEDSLVGDGYSNVPASLVAEFWLWQTCTCHNAILMEDGSLDGCKEIKGEGSDKIFVDFEGNEVSTKELIERIHEFVKEECFKSN